MLHIISITEIKFRQLTRQVLGMQRTQEQTPTVEDTINLVREMQAIRPATPTKEPEADYDVDDTTPLGTAARRRSGPGLVNKLAGRQRVRRDETLGRAFIRNFEKLASQIQTESTAEQSPGDVEAGVLHNFGNFERKSLSTIVKMARDGHYKDHIMKRSEESKKRWPRGFAKNIGGQRQLQNLVQDAKDRKQEEEEEREMMQRGARAANDFLPPGSAYHRSASPAGSARGQGRCRQMNPIEEELDYLQGEFPGYGGGGSSPGQRLVSGWSNPRLSSPSDDVFHD